MFFSTTMIFWPHLARYPAQIIPLCPAPMTTPSYSNILAITFGLKRLERFVLLERLERRCGSNRSNHSKRFSRALQLQIFLHNAPAVITRSRDHGIRRMHRRADLIKPCNRRAVVGDLLNRPLSTHLRRDLPRHPNRAAPQVRPAPGYVEWVHGDFHLDVLVGEISRVATPDS